MGWLSLQNRRDFHKCIMVFKCRNDLAPEYLAEHFCSNDTVHMYNTLNASQFRATRTRTAHYHLSFTVSGSNLWNDLPSNIKKLSSLSSFMLLSYMITTEIRSCDGKINAKVAMKCNNFYDLGDYNKTT